MEKMTLGPKRSQSEYVKLTREALDELFTEEQRLYRVADISELVAKKKGNGYTKAAVQSSVSRALVDLINAEEVVGIERKYIPANKDAIRYILRSHLIDEIEYTREDIFVVFGKMLMIGVASGSIDAAKRLYRDYLGKNCYDVLEYDGYLVLLVVWTKKKGTDGNVEKEDHRKVIQEIRSIVKEGFNKETKKKR